MNVIKKSLFFIIFAAGAGLLAWNYVSVPIPAQWTEREARLIQSLSLSALPELAPDPGNPVADSAAAAELGHRLYFDTRLSGGANVACATCHQPELMFTDGLTLAVGSGLGSRHTPSLVGLAHSPWFYWDGRKDSQWAQALEPLETRHEHDSDRTRISRLLAEDKTYAAMYGEVVGELPVLPDQPRSASPLGNTRQQAAWHAMTESERRAISEVFANVGKALAAYQRKLLPGSTRFDDYADAISLDRATGQDRAARQEDRVTRQDRVTPQDRAARQDRATLQDRAPQQEEPLSSGEIAGLRLFIGKAQCVNCHNGPLFTNHEFHNTGVLSIPGQLPSMGRYDGIRMARQDPFNCLGEFSDANPSDCIELRFARDDNELVGAHKTPGLRNVSLTAPYMHGGQIETLAAVLEHYNKAPVSMLSHNEAKPLGLRAVELSQLEAFIRTLTAPLATPEKWLTPPRYD